MSNSTTTNTSAPPTEIRKHPIRGLLWGLMFGIGLTLVLVITKAISLDLTTMIIVTVIGTVIGVLWGMFGPAKAPKGMPPAAAGHPSPPEVSRFDDFTEAAGVAPVPDPVQASDADEPTPESSAPADTATSPDDD